MIFDQIYQLNWTTIALHLLPHRLRKSRMLSLLQSFIKPIEQIHSNFLSYRSKKNYEIDHTPQVYSIEKVLNDNFDQQQRRIYIVDGFYRSAIYFYNPDENSPVHFYNESPPEPPYFFDPQELEHLDVDFVVVLPLSYEAAFQEGSSQLIRLQSLIDFYRLPDKTYEITFKD